MRRMDKFSYDSPRVGRNTVTDGDPVTVTGNGADSLLPSMIGPCYRRTPCDWTAVAARPNRGKKEVWVLLGRSFQLFFPAPLVPQDVRAPLSQ